MGGGCDRKKYGGYKKYGGGYESKKYVRGDKKERRGLGKKEI